MYFDLRIWLGLVLFRIDVGLFCFLGLLCNYSFFFFLFIFFFFKILVQNLFVIKMLRVFLILLRVLLYLLIYLFFMGKQIIKFKFLYI